MNTTISSIFIEIFSQYAEHNSILQILNHHKIVGYFRYADDIWIIYDKSITYIKKVLKDSLMKIPYIVFHYRGRH
jgi:hypothetical protein